MYHLIIPPGMYEDPNVSASLLACIIDCLMTANLMSDMESHWGLDSYFPSNVEHFFFASYLLVTCVSSLRNIYTNLCAYFKCLFNLSLLLNSKCSNIFSTFWIQNIENSFLSCVICKYFLPFSEWGFFFILFLDECYCMQHQIFSS